MANLYSKYHTRNLIHYLKTCGLDNFETGFQRNIDEAIKDAEKLAGKSLKSNFKLIKGDIRDINDCSLACKGIDYVLHQAALGSVPRSIDNPINTNKAPTTPIIPASLYTCKKSTILLY